MAIIENTTRNPIPRQRKENERVVQFKVPQSVFDRAKAKAHLTGVPWKIFLKNLLEEGGRIEE